MRGRLLDRARRLLGLVLVLGAALIGADFAHAAEDKAVDQPAVLRVLNRDVVTMRAPLVGSGPEVRVQRAEERLREVRPREIIDAPLHTEPLQLGGAKGVQIMSPHFFSQPESPVVVPKAHWFAAPARREPDAT